MEAVVFFIFITTEISDKIKRISWGMPCKVRRCEYENDSRCFSQHNMDGILRSNINWSVVVFTMFCIWVTLNSLPIIG